MKRLFFYFVLIFTATSCCQNEVVSSFEIAEDKKYLIPFEQDSTLTYISQQDVSFSGQATQKKLNIIEDRPGPDSCDLLAFDELKSSVYINTFEIHFEFILSQGLRKEDLTLTLKRIWEDGMTQPFILGDCGGETNLSEELFTDVEINGFLYEDVLIFTSCYMSGIDRIIYSPENGIEFIEFSDGRYLKLKRQ